jgi:hypothetical protein
VALGDIHLSQPSVPAGQWQARTAPVAAYHP